MENVIGRMCKLCTWCGGVVVWWRGGVVSRGMVWYGVEWCGVVVWWCGGVVVGRCGGVAACGGDGGVVVMRRCGGGAVWPCGGVRWWRGGGWWWWRDGVVA